jgi:hypothetical protein
MQITFSCGTNGGKGRVIGGSKDNMEILELVYKLGRVVFPDASCLVTQPRTVAL